MRFKLRSAFDMLEMAIIIVFLALVVVVTAPVWVPIFVWRRL